jgi:hypothetical protein
VAITSLELPEDDPMKASIRMGSSVLLVWVFSALLALLASSAQAVPAFARQTGQNCIACHVSFPELTPYGRWFKLSGYTIGQRQTIPLAVMAQVARTTTKQNEDSTGAPIYARNNDFALNGASLFVGGKATDNIGGLIQWTYSQSYDPGGGSVGHSATDNSDLRVVGRMVSADADDVKLLYGLTVHNSPTVQDVWNTTPAFGFPYTVSPTVPPLQTVTLIEGALAQQSIGVGGYGFYDRTWYGELTEYHAANGAYSIVHAGHDMTTPLSGYNPYLRFAYNKEWDANSLMVGFFGLRANMLLNPNDPINSNIANRFTDLGVDSQYQYISNPHTYTAQVSYIHEKQDDATAFGQGLTANQNNDLSALKVKATYYYDRQYGVTLAGFRYKGSTDALLYGASPVGSPNSAGYIVELNYLPIQNVRLMLQYTGYRELLGSQKPGFDGSSRSPSDNNSLMFNVWVAF